MIFNPLLHSFQSQSFLTFFHYVNQSFQFSSLHPFLRRPYRKQHVYLYRKKNNNTCV